MSWTAITRLTFADAVRQPVTWLMTGLSLALVALSTVFGLFNFVDEDRLRMLATSGVAITVIDGLFLGVVLASFTVHAELADRTALTLFAKPIGRGGFLIGKAAGVWGAVAVSCAIVVAAHLAAVGWAVASGFEFGSPFAHDGVQGDDDVRVPWAALVAAHVLGFTQAGTLAAVAVALAPRLPLAANIATCFALFVVGNLLLGAPAFVVPALAYFNLDETLLLADRAVDWRFVIGVIAYAATYVTGCLFLALAAFKRQDLS